MSHTKDKVKETVEVESIREGSFSNDDEYIRITKDKYDEYKDLKAENEKLKNKRTQERLQIIKHSLYFLIFVIFLTIVTSVIVFWKDTNKSQEISYFYSSLISLSFTAITTLLGVIIGSKLDS